LLQVEVEVADSFETLFVNYDTEAVINYKTTIQANPATYSSAYLPKKMLLPRQPANTCSI